MGRVLRNGGRLSAGRLSENGHPSGPGRSGQWAIGWAEAQSLLPLAEEVPRIHLSRWRERSKPRQRLRVRVELGAAAARRPPSPRALSRQRERGSDRRAARDNGISLELGQIAPMEQLFDLALEQALDALPILERQIFRVRL